MAGILKPYYSVIITPPNPEIDYIVNIVYRVSYPVSTKLTHGSEECLNPLYNPITYH